MIGGDVIKDKIQLKYILIIIISSLFTFIITALFLYNFVFKDLFDINLSDEEYINIVKNSSFYGFPNKKIGPYFNLFFENPKWYIMKKQKNIYVVFEGNAFYFGEYSNFKIIFDAKKTYKTKIIQPIKYTANEKEILYTDFLNLINTIFIER
ncbi:hypothetical protein [Marinitoga sp. 38H-ov]|uniref:hypothetical protein n=1 Tax=Marinitoga sp. 38H-ov TaxID=1755814 RepID=UPI0013E9ABCE|nr:hypothetical protein [Marinitoga sp. 38H-ov]KAF2955491.1 hypothetical protein AS160_09845 [Marinitoga sp. 38H-ov]